MAYCERGKHEHDAAYHRPDFGQVLCPDCYHDALREDSPTGLVAVPDYLRAAKPAAYIPTDPCRGRHYAGRGAARAWRRM
jgi:hypothetical protein